MQPAPAPDGDPAAEQAAQQFASWWRLRFLESEDAELICDSAGQILEANPKALQLFAGADSIPLSSITDRLDGSAVFQVAQLLATRGAHPQLLPSVHLVGTCFGSLIVDLHILPLDHQARLVTIKDVSRRRRMESHLTRLLAAVDATSDVIYIADARFNLTFVNSAFQSVTGYTIEDCLGRPIDFLRAPGQDLIIRECAETLAAEKEWQGELQNRRSDGQTYPVQASISPIFDSDGHFSGYVAFERDISLRRKLEDQLRREHNFTQSIINSLDAAIYTIDRDFKLTHVNDGWKRMPPQHGLLTLNAPPEVGLPLLDLVPNPSKRRELQALFESVLKTGNPHDLSAEGPLGSHWAIKIAPWLHEGERIGLIYIVNNRTQIRELERQLFQAQKMETIGALAAGVAHDFNNLLQAIQGNVNLLLLDQELASAVRERLHQIDQAGGQAADITRQLLAFSRASDEQESILDFNRVIREASQMTQRSLMNKFNVTLGTCDPPPKVRIQPTRAQQMLVNLCVNAQDAMPEGGQLTLANRIIALTPQQAARAGRPAGSPFVRCSVSDTGCGIPSELIQKIFDPFFTTKGAGKGTGLGLSIVHSIAGQAGGFIEVESAPGQGTTFHICLPLAEGEVSSSVRGVGPKLVRGSGRLLVVDDLSLVLDFTSTFLRTAGYEVLTATSTDEAIDLLEQAETPIDLIFTDFNMAGKNGDILIEEVARRWPETKVVLASGFLSAEERTALEQRFHVRVLNKPYNIREAAEIIANLLNSPA